MDKPTRELLKELEEDPKAIIPIVVLAAVVVGFVLWEVWTVIKCIGGN